MTATIHLDPLVLHNAHMYVRWVPTQIIQPYPLTDKTIGFIEGYVTIQEVPVRRIVNLYLEIPHPIEQAPGNLFMPRDYAFVKYMKTDPVTGYYRFDSLDPAQRYTTITVDDGGEYDPAIKSGLIPTLLV